jgi:hypothetical protein
MMLAPATTIVLTVSPSLNAEGRKAYSTRGQLFDGKVDGRTVVKRSTTPFCDAARVLLAEGIKPDTVLVMRHAGSLADALRSTVGAAAGLTVADDKGGKPIFTKWSPYDARCRSLNAPPMRETESPHVRRTRCLHLPSIPRPYGPLCLSSTTTTRHWSRFRTLTGFRLIDPLADSRLALRWCFKRLAA